MLSRAPATRATTPGLESVQDAGHPGGGAPENVDEAQEEEDRGGGGHEEGAGDKAAPGAMHPPAQIGRQLLCLGSRQDHAELQGMQELVLVHPAAPFDQLLMHQGDLSGRTAEADPSQAPPEPGRLLQRRGRRCCGERVRRCLEVGG